MTEKGIAIHQRINERFAQAAAAGSKQAERRSTGIGFFSPDAIEMRNAQRITREIIQATGDPNIAPTIPTVDFIGETHTKTRGGEFQIPKVATTNRNGRTHMHA
jgi:hypothetical protein